mgnify:FL=1|tara:strand:+ start:3001 stop:3231 length:231 start_codon:yes stop_codon:yes gene_type:complete
MKFKFKPKHLEIKFSFKEIILIILRGYFKLDKFTVYKFQIVFFNIIKEMSEKYGDSKEHGQLSKEDLEKPNKEATS